MCCRDGAQAECLKNCLELRKKREAQGLDARVDAVREEVARLEASNNARFESINGSLDKLQALLKPHGVAGSSAHRTPTQSSPRPTPHQVAGGALPPPPPLPAAFARQATAGVSPPGAGSLACLANAPGRLVATPSYMLAAQRGSSTALQAPHAPLPPGRPPPAPPADLGSGRIRAQLGAGPQRPPM